MKYWTHLRGIFDVILQMRVQPCSIIILAIFFELYIFIYMEISESFPKHLFHYSSIQIFFTNTLQHWYRHLAGKERRNKQRKFYICASDIKEPKCAFILYCNFLWQNIKNYGGSQKKMVFGSLKSGVVLIMSELDIWEQFFYNYLAISLVLMFSSFHCPN